MSEYTTKTAKLKTVITKAVITETNRAIIGENTNIDKNGIDTNNITVDLIKTHDDDIYLTKTVADSLYSGTDYSYDWTPSNSLKITLGLDAGSDITAPCNGWFIKNPSTSDGSSSWSISLNGQQMLNSGRNGDMSVQLLLPEGSVLNSSVSTTGYFIPCTSEEDDWRNTEFKAAYDIWKSAVVNDNGNYIVRDQYVPDASGWNSAWKNTFYYQLNNVANDEGRTGENGHLFYIQGENIENGSNLFNGMLLSQIKEDFPNMINGLAMCKDTINLHTFTGNLNSLENGNLMFMNCTKLTTFNGDESGNSVNLGELLNGPQMFLGTGITAFTTDLPELINSNQMFDGSKLTSWTVNMPKLKSGSSMFINNPIASFRGNTPMLQTSENMFSGCSSLTSWSGDLSELMTGYMMFQGASLNAESVANIANTIKNISSIDKNTDSNWEITTGYNYDSKSENRNVISADWRGRIDIYVDSSIVEDEGVKESCSIISDKGWSVYLNGTLMQFFVLLDVYDTNWSVNSNVNSLTKSSAQQITKIVDNDVYDGDELLGTMPIALETVTDVSEGSGSGMFSFTALTSFDSDLSSLTDGDSMFNGCSSLNSFTSNLSILNIGMNMFSNTALTSFNSDLSKLTNGYRMFYRTALASFNSDLSKLTSGPQMFKYCTALESFYSSLASLTDGDNMFYSCTALTSFNSDLSKLTNGSLMFKWCSSLNSFTSDLSSLTDGSNMFSNTALTSFDSDLSSLTAGSYMFRYCTSLTSFDSDLPKLTNGRLMFSDTSLTSFNSDLSSLEDGTEMFRYCSKLTSFNSDLSSLTNGNSMFLYCSALTSFDSDLSSLINGGSMFYNTALAAFNSDLSSLTDGSYMFKYCTNLESFASDLSSLTDGSYMFYNCNLNDASVKNISETINNLANNYTTGNIHLGNISSSNDLISYIERMRYKGWNVMSGANNNTYPSISVADSNYLGYNRDWSYSNPQVQPLTKVVDDIAFNGSSALFRFYPRLSSTVDVSEGSENCGMFLYTALASFDSDLSSLTNGSGMFAVCPALKSFNSDLSSLTNGYLMFMGCSALTSFDSDLSSLTNGYLMFLDCTKFASFDSDLSSLTNGYWMFYFCTALTSFNSDLSSLTNGEGMFSDCTSLTSFDSDLSSLTNGGHMFWNCILDESSVKNIADTINNLSDDTNDGSSGWGQIHIGRDKSAPSTVEEETERKIQLSRIIDKGWTVYVNSNSTAFSRITHDLLIYNTCTTYVEVANVPGTYYKNNIINGEWNHYLDNLTNGERMFYETVLESFNVDLSSLTSGNNMFNGCTSLTSFNSDLSSLTDGSVMFNRCTALTSFNSDLSSLIYGYWMFSGCKLDTASVQNIASTINDLSDDTDDGGGDGGDFGEIHIDIGNTTPNSDEETAFNTMVSKGWTVYVNGSSTAWTSTASTNLTDGEEEQSSTPIPFYAKPIQVTDEDAAGYVDSNNNYYNIVGAQFIYGDDISTYGTFTSFEHAESEIMTALNLTKIDKE